jgi:hypothetical protein
VKVTLAKRKRTLQVRADETAVTSRAGSALLLSWPTGSG